MEGSEVTGALKRYSWGYLPRRGVDLLDLKLHAIQPFSRVCSAYRDHADASCVALCPRRRLHYSQGLATRLDLDCCTRDSLGRFYWLRAQKFCASKGGEENQTAPRDLPMNS